MKRAVNTTPTTCPDCGSALSLPTGSQFRPGMVVQTCKNFETCQRAVWSSGGTVITNIDDGRRHARMFQMTAPPRLVATKNWTSVQRLALRELEALNRKDRKLAAAGGDR